MFMKPNTFTIYKYSIYTCTCSVDTSVNTPTTINFCGKSVLKYI